MTLVVRIARGSGRLVAGGWFRLWAAGERDGDRIGPLLLVAIVTGGLWFVLSRAPILGTPLTLAWLTAAWRAGAPTGVPEDEQGPLVEEQQEESEEPAPPALPDVDELAAALHEIGAPHAHLAVLADHLGLSPAAVREALTEAGIPVSGGCRMKGRGVSTGVKESDFPPLPSPTEAPSGDVVAAGQGDNNNSKRVARWPWGHTVTDPAEQAHHIVAKIR